MKPSISKSLYLVLLLFLSFDLHAAATIFCIHGSCSSGKSSLIQSLDSIDVIDEDALVIERYCEAIAKRFASRYASIEKAILRENHYQALRNGIVQFLDGITALEQLQAEEALEAIQEELNRPENLAWKQAVSQGITNEILDKIATLVQNNKNVLLDAWYIKRDTLQTLFPQAKIVSILIYCPLPIAYERLLQRNRNAQALGNISNRRFVGQLIGSFCSFYQLTNDSKQAIEQVSRDKHNLLFDALYKTLADEDAPRPVFTLRELSKKQLCKFRNDFMQSGEDRVFITPKQPYDYIIINHDSTLAKQRMGEILKMKS